MIDATALHTRLTGVMEYAAESAAIERSVALALTQTSETARDLVTRYGDPTGSVRAYAEAENRAAKAALARARHWERIIEIVAGRA